MNAFKSLLVFLIVFSTVELQAQAPQWEWAKTAVAYAAGTSVNTDNSGNVYSLANYGVPQFVFGTTTLTTYSAYQSNCAVIKQDANGHVIWAVNLGSGNQRGICVAADLNQNVFVLGDQVGSGGSSTDKMFLTKLDMNGTALWTMTTTGTYYCNGVSLTLDNNGNAIVCGRFNGTQMTFNSLTTLQNPDQTTNSSAIFLAKYSTSGSVLWAKTFPGNGNNKGNGPSCITTDANGNIYMAGWFTSPTMTFAATTLTNAGNNPNIFIAKFNQNGIASWAHCAGGVLDDEATSISVDNSGSAYLSGFFSSPAIAFGTTTLTNTNTNWYMQDIFVSKFSSSGNAIWAKSKDGGKVMSSGIDAAGNCYISGMLRDSILFAGTKIRNTNFLAKYDANGSESWIKDIKTVKPTASPNNFVYMYSVCPKVDLSVYLAGSYDAKRLILDTCILKNPDSTGAHQAFFISKIGSTYVGIEEQVLKNTFVIFPNPGSGKFMLQHNASLLTINDLKITDISGKHIPIHFYESGSNIEISLIDPKTGIYFLEINTQDIYIRKKLIVIP